MFLVYCYQNRQLHNSAIFALKTGHATYGTNIGLKENKFRMTCIPWALFILFLRPTDPSLGTCSVARPAPCAPSRAIVKYIASHHIGRYHIASFRFHTLRLLAVWALKLLLLSRL